MSEITISYEADDVLVTLRVNTDNMENTAYILAHAVSRVITDFGIDPQTVCEELRDIHELDVEL